MTSTQLLGQHRGPLGNERLPWDDPAFELDPYPWYARVQAESPVFVDERGVFVVTKYEDVMTFGKQPSMSVEPGWAQAGPWAVVRETMIGRDDPDHTRLRRQTNKWFTPKLVQNWVTTTAAVTDELLDAVQGDTIDGWHDLAVVPTHRTMCRVLQLPSYAAHQVKAAMERTMPMLSARPRPGALEDAGRAFDSLTALLSELMEPKRREPGDGLADMLLEAADRGDMSLEEAHATILMLYTLGHMDVGYLVAAGFLVFTQRPDVFRDYRDRPELRDAIVNEIARFDPPELSFYRTATQDLTIRGVDIPAGSTVRYMIGAANRDPDYFDDPQTFDHHRPMEHSRNLSFGVGLHSCAGQVISRAEARAIFETVAARFSAIELAEPVVMDNTDFSRHFKKLTQRPIP